MFVWQAHKGKVDSLAFGPDGRLLATATGGTRTVHLWEPTTGTLVRKLAGDWPDGRGLGAVKSVAFAPGAPLLAAGTARSVTVWRTDNWVPVADLATAYAYELAFGPGASPRLAASSSYDHTGIWDDPGRPTGLTVRRPDRHVVPRGVAALDFSPDGRLLAGNSCYDAMLWDPATGKEVRDFDRSPGNHRGAVRFSPDGARLAAVRGKWVDLWDVADPTRPAVTIQAGTGRQPAVWALGWASDGRVLMTAGADGFVRFWDIESRAELRSFSWGIGKVYCAAFAPDGLTCAAAGENGQVVVWDVDA